MRVWVGLFESGGLAVDPVDELFAERLKGADDAPVRDPTYGLQSEPIVPTDFQFLLSCRHFLPQFPRL